jgi:pyruvate/2-oxoacid:ferredoxin oxidoreductase beta subunit
LKNKAWEYKWEINKSKLDTAHFKTELQKAKTELQQNNTNELRSYLQYLQKQVEGNKKLSDWIKNELEQLEKHRWDYIKEKNKTQEQIITNQTKCHAELSQTNEEKRKLEKEVKALELRKDNAIKWIELSAQKRRNAKILESRLRRFAKELNINVDPWMQ